MAGNARFPNTGRTRQRFVWGMESNECKSFIDLAVVLEFASRLFDDDMKILTFGTRS
jgi:hypothetical protein